jgi:hypothetical protein
MTKPTEYREKAESLIFLANSLAISSIDNLSDKFPVLENIVDDDRFFVFLLTVAGAAAGVTLVDESIPEDEFQKFSRAVAEKLMNWDFLGYKPYGVGGAYKAYEDLSNFVKGKDTENMENFLAMGYWLVFNLKGSRPTKEEALAGGAIGQFLAVSLLDWWNKV